MGSILIALLAPAVVIGLIVGGTRISLYLFIQNVEASKRFAHRMPAVDERSLQENEPTVKSPVYYRVLNMENSNTRYAWRSLVVIALVLLLAIMASISLLTQMLN
ncbi:MAG: hypothetical protein NVS3B14_07430 [Ktedonobacteraceae bacterium]